MNDTAEIKRRNTTAVRIGAVTVGGDAPVVVQSMTSTDTADIEATVDQIEELAAAGSELVRVTVNNREAAVAVPKIVTALDQRGVSVPIIGDFHFNGHKLLEDVRECGQALAKYRINPGTVGKGDKRDEQFIRMVHCAVENGKPVRIGVNWGSLDQTVLADLLDQNQALAQPKSLTQITREAMVQSALMSARLAETHGLAPDRIILSCKVSEVPGLVAIHRDLAQRCSYPIHLGLTEAGMGRSAIIASTAALSILLQDGIGDTIRVSLTPEPEARRSLEVKVARDILQSLGIRTFTPKVTACPGCGRTTSTRFRTLASEVQEYIDLRMPVWKQKYVGVENLKIAVMGCVVNGPGESKMADLGISLPGTGEDPVAPVYVDGEKLTAFRGSVAGGAFTDMIEAYVSQKYAARA